MKVGFFITARLKSSRLKQKILLELNRRSVIDRVIERAKNVIGTDGVVLCTSTNPQDSVLYQNALKNKIQFYAGSEKDVLKRLLDAAEYYDYDAFMQSLYDCKSFMSIRILKKVFAPPRYLLENGGTGSILSLNSTGRIPTGKT